MHQGMTWAAAQLQAWVGSCPKCHQQLPEIEDPKDIHQAQDSNEAATLSWAPKGGGVACGRLDRVSEGSYSSSPGQRAEHLENAGMRSGVLGYLPAHTHDIAYNRPSLGFWLGTRGTKENRGGPLEVLQGATAGQGTNHCQEHCPCGKAE
jgi:hypothetical protein